MTDPQTTAPATAADAAQNRADVAKKIGYIGARLREKSTYGGLAIVIGVLAHMLAVYFPQLASIDIATVADAVSAIGIGVGILIGVFLPEKTVAATVVKILLVAFVLSLFLATGSQAAGPLPFKPTGDLKGDIDRSLGKTPAVDPKAPVADGDQQCDISILPKLTPKNLVPTIKKCISNTNQQLVNDTARALASAKGFNPNPDQDGINCLAPGLALFQAGVQVPAVADVPAVLNPDGSVKTAAVAGTPVQDPGPILLFQKYREFVLSGGLTSCQNYVNTPVNATIAAAANGVGQAAVVGAGAALLAPVK